MGPLQPVTISKLLRNVPSSIFKTTLRILLITLIKPHIIMKDNIQLPFTVE